MKVINAEQARQLTEDILNKRCEEEISTIMTKIENAITNGISYIFNKGVLSRNAIDTLLGLGYKIIWNQTDDGYNISWHMMDMRLEPKERKRRD
jgi:hypothetical protein